MGTPHIFASIQNLVISTPSDHCTHSGGRYFLKNIKLDQADIEPQGHTQLLTQLLMQLLTSEAVADA